MRASNRIGSWIFASFVFAATSMARTEFASDVIETDSLATLLAQHPDKFKILLADPARYRMQILVSEVAEGASGARLRRYGYRVDAEYFYPASAIKSCAAIAALQFVARMRHDHGPEIGIDTPLRFEPLFDGQKVEERDDSNLGKESITVGHEIRKLFLVSDNDAFNRLYDLVGHRGLNESMWAAGLDSVRIRHRLSITRTPLENLHTRAFEFQLADSTAVDVKERTSDLALALNTQPGVNIGDSYYSGTTLKHAPMPFADKNRISLVDLQDLHVMLLRPDVRLAGKRGLDLNDADREFVKKAMAQYPAESTNPVYDEASHPDDYVKFILHGVMRVAPKEDLVVYDKIGLAYGFTIENAYVVNQRTGKSFFLTATLYTNDDGILNDDEYDYESIAFPYWKDLGEVVARWKWE